MLRNPSSSDLTDKILALCERLADVKTLQENPSLYVTALGSYTMGGHLKFDLEKVVKEKLLANDCQVVLLLAEAGSGKSLFGQTLVRKMAQTYQAGNPIPLFISLPSLKNPRQDIMYETLTRHGFERKEIEELKNTQSFFLVLDAYDEIHLVENLILTNRLSEWQAKILISCRPSYLDKVPNYQQFFTPYGSGARSGELLQELYVASFSTDQIELYIEKYLEVYYENIQAELSSRPQLTNKWLKPKAYLEGIEQIPGLQELIHTPFLLRITMEVLPTVMAEFEAVQDRQERFKMTQASLYDAFTARWFSREEEKLVLKGEHPGRGLKNAYLKFAKDLAVKMYEHKIRQVTYEGEDLLDPESESEWAFFFCDDMIPSDKGNSNRRRMRVLCRRACPIYKVGDNQFAFIHAAIFEYFFAQAMPGKTIEVPTPNLPDIPNNDVPPGPEKPTPPPPGSSLSDKPEIKIIHGEGGGSYELIKRLSKKEAKKLWKEEGIRVEPTKEVGEKEKEKEKEKGKEKEVPAKKVTLGEGNFGKVGLARHMKNGRFVGVKKIKGEIKILSSKNEAELQAKLNGLPHVMPLWDFVSLTKASGEQVYYQFMPLAGLGNGDEFLKQWQRWPGKISGCELLDRVPSFKLKLLIQVAKDALTGIHHMHLHGIYHMDIKPDNIVIDHFGRVFVIDFGCSQQAISLTGEQDSIRVAPGHRGYFSPERLEGEQEWVASRTITHSFDAAKADAWALGVMLLQILLGYHPFGGPPFFTIRNWKRVDFERCLAQISVLVDPPAESLMAVIKGLLAVNPQERFSVDAALRMPIFQQADLLFTHARERKKAFNRLFDEEERKEAEILASPSFSDRANETGVSLEPSSDQEPKNVYVIISELTSGLKSEAELTPPAHEATGNKLLGPYCTSPASDERQEGDVYYTPLPTQPLSTGNYLDTEEIRTEKEEKEEKTGDFTLLAPHFVLDQPTSPSPEVIVQDGEKLKEVTAISVTEVKGETAVGERGFFSAASQAKKEIATASSKEARDLPLEEASSPPAVLLPSEQPLVSQQPLSSPRADTPTQLIQRMGQAEILKNKATSAEKPSSLSLEEEKNSSPSKTSNILSLWRKREEEELKEKKKQGPGHKSTLPGIEKEKRSGF